MPEPPPTPPVANMQNNFNRIAAAVPTSAYLGSYVSGGSGYMPLGAVRGGCFGFLVVLFAIGVGAFATWLIPSRWRAQH